jgi:hypothetical protein
VIGEVSVRNIAAKTLRTFTHHIEQQAAPV